mgnify:CR=1 FL=1
MIFTASVAIFLQIYEYLNLMQYRVTRLVIVSKPHTPSARNTLDLVDPFSEKVYTLLRVPVQICLEFDEEFSHIYGIAFRVTDFLFALSKLQTPTRDPSSHNKPMGIFFTKRDLTIRIWFSQTVESVPVSIVPTHPPHSLEFVPFLTNLEKLTSEICLKFEPFQDEREVRLFCRQRSRAQPLNWIFFDYFVSLWAKRFTLSAISPEHTFNRKHVFVYTFSEPTTSSLLLRCFVEGN